MKRIFFMLLFGLCFSCFANASPNLNIRNSNRLSESSQNNRFHLHPRYANYLARRDSLTKSAFFFKAKTDEKIVVLSFDDGPTARHTERLTTFLREKECPAVFFILGSQVTRALIALYDDPLFEVGCHGFYHHNYIEERDVNVMIEDFRKATALHHRFRPGKLKYYRPPFGVINRSMVGVMKSFNLEGVLWSFDVMDFLFPPHGTRTRQHVLDDINNNLSNGHILLLHEGINLNLLGDIIDLIREKGFRIVTLSELMEADRGLK
jgi:peptidoglycan/xylan/chitin deacetylase (PgdA/CDA1 family)